MAQHERMTEFAPCVISTSPPVMAALSSKTRGTPMSFNPANDEKPDSSTPDAAAALVRAGRAEELTHRPDDFLNWLRANGVATPSCSVVRKVFGDYVRLGEEFRRAAGRGGRLLLTRGEALDLRVAVAVSRLRSNARYPQSVTQLWPSSPL